MEFIEKILVGRCLKGIVSSNKIMQYHMLLFKNLYLSGSEFQTL